MSLGAIPKGNLREGFTTGTCATASTKAALWALLTGEKLKEATVFLPIKKTINIPIKSCTIQQGKATCTVIKDAGDDPDVTHKAEIGATIRLTKEQGVFFKRGQGVGVVTLPGLQLNVGEPAINAVPRKMMTATANKLFHDFNQSGGVEIEVFVKNGEALAKQTLNERVGIQNGLSILGTTGIVKPYSSSAYIASIVQGIDVAEANGINELIINSGGKTEAKLKELFPSSPDLAFVQYGNWIGQTLRKIARSKIEKVNLGIMLGKAVKLAEGRTDTHSCVSSWNKNFVKNLATEAGYNNACNPLIDALNIAGRLTEIFPFSAKEIFYNQLLTHCYNHCKQLIRNKKLTIFLIGKDHTIIRYPLL